MIIERIISLQNARFKSAMKLFSSRGRQRQDRIIVLGLREVLRAAASGAFLEEVIIEDGTQDSLESHEDFQQLKSHAMVAGGCRYFAFASELFHRLSYGERKVAVIGIARRPNTDLHQLPASSGKSKGIVLVLEALEKPGNLGAIARSADAVGVDAILIADSLTDPFHPNAIRSSVSTVFSVPIACGTSDEIQKWLLANEYRIKFATPEAERSLFEINLEGKVALVFGNEALGLSSTWKVQGEGVSLPMMGVGDSLNVSVTASIMLFEIMRQKRQKS